MKHLSVMIKPASSLCNMQCRYCFYADISKNRSLSNYGIMQSACVDNMIKNIYINLSDRDMITFAFQGGEPTLAGLDYFIYFINAVKRHSSRIKVQYVLQTNGLLLDDAWCAFLKKNNFLVGLSLDGFSSVHNQNRIDSAGNGTFNRIMKTKKRLDTHCVDYNILCVLTNETARHPKKIWRFIVENKIRYIQFIPCLNALNTPERSVWALTPPRFFNFYHVIFDEWKKEVLAGNYISIKLFDDIANQYIRNEISACGMNGQCQVHFVIEADGSIYPCDFYVLDQYLLGNINETTLQKAFDNAMTSGFLNSRTEISNVCLGCRYVQVCHGGCKRMTREMYVGPNGFCGYKAFLDNNLDTLCQTALRLIEN